MYDVLHDVKDTGDKALALKKHKGYDNAIE